MTIGSFTLDDLRDTMAAGMSNADAWDVWQRLPREQKDEGQRLLEAWDGKNGTTLIDEAHDRGENSDRLLERINETRERIRRRLAS